MQIAGPWKSPRREEDASRRTLVGGPVLMQRWMALIDEEALVTTKEHAGKSNRMGVKGRNTHQGKGWRKGQGRHTN